MTGADILLPLLWAAFLFVVFRWSAKTVPHVPPQLPPDLEDIRRPKK